MFKLFQTAVYRQFDNIKDSPLFRTEVDGDELWRHYIESFPEGANPKFRERTEHDCSCCRRFIRDMGNVVTIKSGKLVSIWDLKTEVEHYQVVADAMAQKVKSKPIQNIFLYGEDKIGTKFNKEMLASGEELIWNHFHVDLPSRVVIPKKNIDTRLSHARSTRDVFDRALREFTLEALETVLDLIDQGTLYRGDEHRHKVATFKKLKVKFDKTPQPDSFVWRHRGEVNDSISRIRNSAVGTLLVDLSQGKDLNDAVKSYEVKVAPQNYKRPKALVSKKMIQDARNTLEELGFISSLGRRFASINDITINNIIFADRETKKEMDVFDEMMQETRPNLKSLDKVEEIHIEDFLASVLPHARSIKLFFENKHAGNLVSLIAPQDPEAKSLFQWGGNNFSWTYAGDVADSIKTRVKNAGGSVEGDFRASLSWFNFDDLDLHLKLPGGEKIGYQNKFHSETRGSLDVDMNVSAYTREAVENITFPDRRRMLEGRYDLIVHNYTKREHIDVGFEVEMEFDGVNHSFAYDKEVRASEAVKVASFNYSHKRGLEIIESIEGKESTKTIWGIPTQQFHRVRTLMFSPNFWDEQAIGNKHYFFILDGCLNDTDARGFYNEFLKKSLHPHRKVFEILGSKMRAPYSNEQLSGLGFSSTLRNQVVCEVEGSFKRRLKLLF
jgi:hypothetical protein